VNRGSRPAAVATEPDNPEAAYRVAVKQLARQPQPRAALERRLQRLGYEEVAISAALDRAQSKGYLDDRAYADAVVRRRTRGRGHGLIARELRSKGIPESDIAGALGLIDPETELERALTLGRETLRKKRVLDPGRIRETVGPVLSRRGFETNLIHQVCRKLFSEWPATASFDTSSEPD
jgi:regulatory protein